MGDGGVTYKKTCLTPEAKCEIGEAHAELYDFVNAAFIEGDGKKFDGNLTPEEKAAVVQKFGEMTTPKEFMSKVNQDFFQKYQNVLTCSIDAPKYADVLKDDSRGVFLAGSHGCGELYAQEMNQKGILFEIMARPEEWVFMIEGINASLDGISAEKLDGTLPELPYFRLLADIFNIPKRDPVISLWDDRTLSLVESRTGTTKMDFAVAYTFANLEMVSSKLLHLPESKLVELSLELSEQVFKDYNVVLNTEDLAKRFREELKAPDGKDEYEYMRAKIESSVALVFSTDPISNELSGNLAREFLKETGRKKALFVVGSGHFSIKGIYD